MNRKIPRWQKKQLERMMAERRVLLLAGARQTGKTTLAKSLVSSDTEYRTLDNPAMREAAEADPVSFIKHEGQTLIIDEVQHVPALLSAIKMAVDENNRPGQFLLTGSANLSAIPQAQESLAGRISKTRLRPIAQGEIQQVQPDFFERLLDGNLQKPEMTIDRDLLLMYAFRGGYPETLPLDEQATREWHKDYLSALLERDLKDIRNVHRMDAMRKLIEILAAWSSKLMEISGIASKLSIRRPTVESYINALEALFIVDRIPAWTKTDYQRVGKQDKLFMADSGLMGSILDWRLDQVRFDSDRSGKLIETFAYNEISAILDASKKYKLYHYRDRLQREIDFLIERLTDDAIVGVEVKASATARKEDFKHLAWFRDNEAKDKKFQGVVLYSGNEILSFGPSLTAVPFNVMWTENAV